MQDRQPGVRATDPGAQEAAVGKDAPTMTAEERAQFLTKEKQQNAENARLAKEQRLTDAAKAKEEKQALFQARQEADRQVKTAEIQKKAEAKAARKAARGVGFEAAKG